MTTLHAASIPAALPYSYQRLADKEEIRLLRVSRVGKYDIISVRLEDAPRYEAVSYVWGDPAVKKQVVLADGTFLLVTPSVVRALPCLISKCKTGYLWIDQITINQSDIHERSDQVRMMGDIYRKCYRCLIWIDTDHSIVPESDFPLTWHQGTGDAVRMYLKSFRQGSIPQSLRDNRDGKKHMPDHIKTLPEPTSEVREHLLWFLEHPWFTRTWVFQEFVLPVETVFVFEDFELASDILRAVFQHGYPRTTAWFDSFHSIFKINQRRASNFDDAPGLEFLLSAFAIGSLFRGLEIPRAEDIRAHDSGRDCFSHYESCTFIDMVGTMAASQAVDERDHVYALIGFAPFLLRHMPVDYALPIAAVFANTTKALIKEAKSLSFLHTLPSEVDTSRSRLDLPSWVPNWTVRHSTYSITCHDNLFCASGRYFGLPEVRDCSHYSPTSILWQDLPWNELKVAGQIIDVVGFTVKQHSIYQTSPVTTIDVHHGKDRKPWEKETLEAILSDLTASGCATVSKLSRSALLRTLLMDGVQWAALDALASNEDLYRTDVRIFDLPHYEKMANVVEALVEGPDIDFDKLPHQASLKLLHELSKIQYHRRLFLTDKHFFGLGPDHVLKDDLIALLHGCRTPVVLRRRPEGKYTVIGPCFRDGAMYGELADLVDERAHIFTLV